MEHGTYAIRAISRASSILKALLGNAQGLKLDELAAATGLHRSTVYRILTTLEEEGFVEHDEQMRYHLGMACIQLGGFAHRNMSWSRAAQVVTDRIRERTGESTSVHARSGWEVVCVANSPSRYNIQIVNYVGRTFPIHKGAAGKVVLANLPEEKVREFLIEELPKSAKPLERIYDVDAFLRELATIREQGYCISPLVPTEVIMDGMAIAAPIRDVGGSVVAALTIAGPSERMNFDTVPALIPVVVEGAQQISARLGSITVGTSTR